MDSTRARAIRDARQESVLARLINEGLESDTQIYSDMTVERWFQSLQSTSSRILRGRMPTQISGPPHEYAFSEGVRVLHTICMVLPTHPNYDVFTADPLVRTEMDKVSQFTIPPMCLFIPFNGQSRRDSQHFTICFEIDHVFHSYRLQKSSLSASKTSSEIFWKVCRSVTQTIYSKMREHGID